MADKYLNTCTSILRHKDHRDKHVRRTVLAFIPELAEFHTQSFVTHFLKDVLSHIFSVLKTQDRKYGYLALGRLSMAVQDAIFPYADKIFGTLKEGITPKTRRACICEATLCIGMVAKALRTKVIDSLVALLDMMFRTGLQPSLITALGDISTAIPSLLPKLQQRLIKEICRVLNEGNVKVVPLALESLGTFNMQGLSLTAFCADYVVPFLDSDDHKVRLYAAQTCCRILINPENIVPPRTYLGRIICDTVAKLLNIAVTDRDATIRQRIVDNLDVKYDLYLCSPEHLQYLFYVLHDEEFQIRETVIELLGRLSTRNPAYIMPRLRNFLVQLLTDLEINADLHEKEISSRLMTHFIRAVPSLITPYVPSILRVLLSIVKTLPQLTQYALPTLGELAIVGGEQLSEHIEDLLELVLDCLQDQGSPTKRAIGVEMLGKLVQSTGYVIEPYKIHPHLLTLLLSMLKMEESWEIRKNIMSVLGTIGAFDPYAYKQFTESTNTKGQAETDILPGMGTSYNDYYPEIAVHSLLKILNDPSLTVHHAAAVEALINVMRSLDMDCVIYLPKIVPPLIQRIKSSEPVLRKPLFHNFSHLIHIAKQHMKQYLDNVFELIRMFWDSELQLAIIELEENVCRVFSEEFSRYLPEIMPQLISLLQNPQSPHVTEALQALGQFSKHLDSYLYLVIPTIVRLLDTEYTVQAMTTLRRIACCQDLSEFSSRILHPLCRLMPTTTDEQLKETAVQLILALVHRMKAEFTIFRPMVLHAAEEAHLQHRTLYACLDAASRGEPLPYQLQPVEEDKKGSDVPPTGDDVGDDGKFTMKPENIVKACEASRRSAKEDWIEWIRSFSVQLLKESPSAALRACANLANNYYPLARELFNAGFTSCWNELTNPYHEDVVKSLTMAFSRLDLPPEVLQTLLNLVEFIQHDEKPLPIDSRGLGGFCVRCQAYAKALHFKEMEFQEMMAAAEGDSDVRKHSSEPEPQDVNDLISLYNRLQHHESAVGVLTYAQRKYDMEMRESWYENLHRWEEAYEIYEKRYQEETRPSFETTKGRMRCLMAMGEWDRLLGLSRTIWDRKDLAIKVAPMAANAAWHMGCWAFLAEACEMMNVQSADGCFFRAIMAVNDNDFPQAQLLIEEARKTMDTGLVSLVAESYSRAYENIIRLQQLRELEEVVQYKTLLPQQQRPIREMWDERLTGVTRKVEYWQDILAVRKLVLAPREDVDVWLQFCVLARRSGKVKLSEQTLLNLLDKDVHTQFLKDRNPQILIENEPIAQIPLAYCEHLWDTGERQQAFDLLAEFAQNRFHNFVEVKLGARTFLRYGQWLKHLSFQPTVGVVQESAINDILMSFERSTEFDPSWYKSWHSWGMMNSEVVRYHQKQGQNAANLSTYIVSAVNSFFKSIRLSLEFTFSIQDILRLLTLWFDYAAIPQVEEALRSGFEETSIITWLPVLPQIIARVNTAVLPVRSLVHKVLLEVGIEHPQALIYPLCVGARSSKKSRQSASSELLDQLKAHNELLVEQSLMVSTELIRVAILWNEMWHDGIEEAWKCYMSHDLDGMLGELLPLYELLDNPITTNERAFKQTFGGELADARKWLDKYRRTRKESDLKKAWDFFYHVFHSNKTQLQYMTTIDLQSTSTQLFQSRNLDLAVPGTYKVGQPVVHIESFAPQLRIMMTKQRPRKLTIHGSDGQQYTFLLKGHEDLRQDERVMQLFGLINTLVAKDHETSSRDLSIQRFEVIPLSGNAGLIGWLPNCDTLHELIKDYRTSRNILLNQEHRLMINMAPEYDKLTVMQKVEVFEYALERTPGNDLYKVLWLKSRNSEVWLDRRTNYTRSLAVMSMVGYILGLGDRHPSNIMLQRNTGKIVHIDFGDCFEVAMHRDKFAEKVPFRLTRMLRKAMEVCGIEGHFRSTSESVMRVLRENKDSVMAMLEAFVHDPLINWRLLGTKKKHSKSKKHKKRHKEATPPPPSEPPVMPGSNAATTEQDPLQHIPRSVKERELRKRIDESERDYDILNEKALTVINRIQEKLTGTDFGKHTPPLDTESQVNKLIRQATSSENLCQSFVGWCAFW